MRTFQKFVEDSSKVKALFLDVDGVFTLRHPKVLDPEPLEYLKQIIGQTGAIIILSSDWRHYDMGPLKQQLGAVGLNISDITGTHGTRADEIQRYLYDHPEIKKFAIIDDNKYAMIPNHPESFFQTKWKDSVWKGFVPSNKPLEDAGLTKSIADAIIRYLNS